MKTIDSIEFGVIEESTKIVVPRSLIIGDQAAQQPYCVVTEDMDKINVSHVFEGMLFITGWNRLSAPQQANAKNLLLEGFDGDAWKYEEQIEQIVDGMRVGIVGLGKVNHNHHICRMPVDTVLEQVLKANPSNLIVSTLNDSWQVGLLIAATRLIKVEPPRK